MKVVAVGLGHAQTFKPGADLPGGREAPDHREVVGHVAIGCGRKVVGLVHHRTFIAHTQLALAVVAVGCPLPGDIPHLHAFAAVERTVAVIVFVTMVIAVLVFVPMLGRCLLSAVLNQRKAGLPTV